MCGQTELIHCDRCQRDVPGILEGPMTAGVYNVADGYWAKYAKPGEKVLCDCCMWAEPMYQADYGHQDMSGCFNAAAV